jgi:hypothetical protein
MLLRDAPARVKQNFPKLLPPRPLTLKHVRNLALKLLLQPVAAEENFNFCPFNLKQKSNMKKTTKTVSTVKAAAKKSPAPAPVPAAPAKKSAAPAKKKPAVATEPPATFISAKIDIGFGNHLFVRGSGPGLSWDRGVAMDCVGTGLWTLAVKNATQPVTFKVLVNDLSWCAGDDYVAAPGQSVNVVPTF